MAVHLIKKKTIEDYMLGYPQSRTPFEEWLSKLRRAVWRSPADIKSTFPSADLLGNGCSRVVFDIGGNNFRMICKYLFGESETHLFVCWIGTHAEYDSLCRERKQYFVSNF